MFSNDNLKCEEATQSTYIIEISISDDQFTVVAQLRLENLQFEEALYDINSVEYINLANTVKDQVCTK